MPTRRCAMQRAKRRSTSPSANTTTPRSQSLRVRNRSRQSDCAGPTLTVSLLCEEGGAVDDEVGQDVGPQVAPPDIEDGEERARESGDQDVSPAPVADVQDRENHARNYACEARAAR